MQPKQQSYKQSINFHKMNLVLVETKEKFEELCYAIDGDKEHEKSLKTADRQESQTKALTNNNQNIQVPRHGKISQKEHTLQKRHPNIQHHGYFKTHQLALLPNRSSQTLSTQYHITQHDLEFLHSLRQQYKPQFKQSYALSIRTFCDIITNCEHNLHLQKIITLQTSSRDILLTLEFKLPSKLTSLTVSQRISLREMFVRVIQYWKKAKIQKYKSFPILRHLWPKTDIQQQKYSFFVPYKSRTLQKQYTTSKTFNKQQPNYAEYRNKFSSIKNKSGRTEKQVKIGRQSRQASDFFAEFKKIVEENKSQRELFENEMKRFHCYAGMYQCNGKPVWHDNVNDNQIRKSQTQSLKSIASCELSKLGKLPYFNSPTIKLRRNNDLSYCNKWKISSQYRVKYDIQKKQIVVENEQIRDSSYGKKGNKRVKKSQ